MAGLGMLADVGFTVPLLIGELAFGAGSVRAVDPDNRLVARGL
ncbi:hypothetical protein [Dactylosporangium sp. NPDC005555]